MRRARCWIAIAPLLAAGCARQEPIRVGMVSTLTGRASDLGLSSRSGVTLAVEELNAAGGIRGRPIELVIRDDGQRPEQAREAVRELVDLGVVAMIGHATSGMAAATLAEVNRAQVLMVSPTVTSPDFRGQDDWFVMLMATNDHSAARIAAAAVERAAARRVVVVLDTTNAAFTRTYAAAFARELSARGGMVRELPFASGTGRSFGELADRALQGEVDAVMVIASAVDTAAVFQQVRKRSRTVRLLGCDWGFTQEILAEGGAATEGALFPHPVNMQDRGERFRGFLAAYDARFHRSPDFAAVVSYEAMQLLAEGLRRDPTRAGVRRAVTSMEGFEGLQAPVRIDRFGDADRPIYLFRVQGGRMVPQE